MYPIVLPPVAGKIKYTPEFDGVIAVKVSSEEMISSRMADCCWLKSWRATRLKKMLVTSTTPITDEITKMVLNGMADGIKVYCAKNSLEYLMLLFFSRLMLREKKWRLINCSF
jgi:hypothetical protein